MSDVPSLSILEPVKLRSGGEHVADRLVTTTFANTITFVLCDYRTVAQVGATVADQKGRQITINQTGRAVSARRTCVASTG